MQKPDHVDNKLLVENLSDFFFLMEIFLGFLFQLNHSLNNTTHSVSRVFIYLVALMRLSEFLSWPREIWLSGYELMRSMRKCARKIYLSSFFFRPV